MISSLISIKFEFADFLYIVIIYKTYLKIHLFVFVIKDHEFGFILRDFEFFDVMVYGFWSKKVCIIDV